MPRLFPSWRGAAFVAALAAGVAATFASACADPSSPQGRRADLPLTATLDKDTLLLSETTRFTVRVPVAPDQRASRGVAHVTWASSDTSVAAVDYGSWDDSVAFTYVRARAGGRVTLTAAVRLRDSSTSTVTAMVVIRPAGPLVVWPDTNAIVPGLVRQLAARDEASSNFPTPAAGVRWTSDAPDVATVDDSGRVTARALGRATITAETSTPGAFPRRATAVVVVRGYPAPLEFASIATAASPTFPTYPHACGLTRDGRAYCWGEDFLGSLGTNDVMDRCETPVQASSTGHQVTLYRTRFRCSATPVEVAGGHRFAQLSAYASRVCGVTTDGGIYCWGADNPSNLGADADPAVQSVPRRVDAPVQFRQVAPGLRFVCALDVSGAAYCWGRNRGAALGFSDRGFELGFIGLLGTGSADSVVAGPQRVLGGLTFASLSASNSHVCGVTPAGLAWCWGESNFGELGNGRPQTATCASMTDSTCYSFSLRPTAVQGGLTFRQVTSGELSTCGVTTSDALWCWGAMDVGASEPGYYATWKVSRAPARVTEAPPLAALTSPPLGGAGHARPSCGLGLDGGLTCFPNSPTTPAPAARGVAFAQAAGPGSPYFDRGGCGVGRDGVAYCWYPAMAGARGDGTIVTEGDVGGVPARVAGQR